MAFEDTIEIVSKSGQSGFGFYFRPTPSSHTYRLAPDRHPAQPRFWCVWIHRCARGEMTDPEEKPWLSDELIPREELAATLLSIRENLPGWIERGGDGLRAWLAQPAPVPVKP